MDQLSIRSPELPPRSKSVSADDVEALLNAPVERLPQKSVNSMSVPVSDDSTSDDGLLGRRTDDGRVLGTCGSRFQFSLAHAFALLLFVVLAAFSSICALYVVSSERQMHERAHMLAAASLLNGQNQVTSTIRQHSIVLTEMMVTAMSGASFVPFVNPSLLNESWVRENAAPRYSLFRPPMLGKPSIYQLYEVCGMHAAFPGHATNVGTWYATGCNKDYCYYCNEISCWNSLSSLNASYADVMNALPITGGLLLSEFVAAPIVVQNRSRLFLWNMTPSFSLSRVKQQWSEPYYELNDGSDNASASGATLLISLMQCTFFNKTTNQCNHAFGVDMNLSYMESVVREVSTTSVSTTALVDLRSRTILASNAEDESSASVTTALINRVIAMYLANCPCYGTTNDTSTTVGESDEDDDNDGSHRFPCDTSVTVHFEEQMLAYQRIEPFGGSSVSFLLLDFTPETFYTQGPRSEMYRSIAVIAAGCVVCLAISGVVYYSIASPVQLLVKNFDLAARFRNDEVVIHRVALKEIGHLFAAFSALNGTLSDAKPFLPQCILALASKEHLEEECDPVCRAAAGNEATESAVGGGVIQLPPRISNPIDARCRASPPDDVPCSTAEIANARDEDVVGCRNLSFQGYQPADGDERFSADGGTLSGSCGSTQLSTPRRSSLSTRVTTAQRFQQSPSLRAGAQTSLGLPMVGNADASEGDASRNQRRKVSFEMTEFPSVSAEARAANEPSTSGNNSSSSTTASEAMAKRKARMRSLLSSCLREQLSCKCVTVLFGNANRFHDLCKDIGANEAAAAFDLVLRSLEDNASRFGGVVDWFHGDRVMLTFGASSANSHHGRSCGEVLRGVTSFLRHRIRHACDMSFGVASGTAMCGYTGTATMRRFSTIGPVVSYAARMTELCQKGISNASILVSQHAASDLRHSMTVEPCTIASLCNGKVELGPQLAHKSGRSKPCILFRAVTPVCDENGLPFVDEEEADRRQSMLSLFGALAEGRLESARAAFERSRETLGPTFSHDFERELLRCTA